MESDGLDDGGRTSRAGPTEDAPVISGGAEQHTRPRLSFEHFLAQMTGNMMPASAFAPEHLGPRRYSVASKRNSSSQLGDLLDLLESDLDVEQGGKDYDSPGIDRRTKALSEVLDEKFDGQVTTGPPTQALDTAASDSPQGVGLNHGAVLTADGLSTAADPNRCITTAALGRVSEQRDARLSPTLSSSSNLNGLASALRICQVPTSQLPVASVLEAWDTIYLPDLDRLSVIDRLQDAPDGSFVIRPSTQHDDHKALCVKFGTIVLHFLIEKFDGKIEGIKINGGSRLHGSGLVFHSLMQMISYYVQQRDDLPCRLVLPADISSTDNESASTSRASSPPPSRRGTLTSRRSRPSHQSVRNLQQASENLCVVDLESESPVRSTSSLESARQYDSSSENEEGLREQETVSAGDFFRSRIPQLLRRRRRPKHVRKATERMLKFVKRLVRNPRSTEGRTVDNFLACTLDSEESASEVVMRNIRQFMDGMKNYFFTQYARKMQDMLPDDITRDTEDAGYGIIDSVIEMVLQQYVIEPLCAHVYEKIVRELAATRALETFRTNVQIMKATSPQEMGLDSKYLPNFEADSPAGKLRQIGACQNAARKLQYLLEAVTAIHEQVQNMRQRSSFKEHREGFLGADDFLPIFIYVLVQSGLTMAEVEAQYMWGLVDPNLLMGQSGYYLTTLSSAIHAIKTSSPQDNPLTRAPTMEDVQGFLRIYLDVSGLTAHFKTLPIQATMTCSDAITFICKKFHLDQPKDYVLVEATPECERVLESEETPYSVKASWPPQRVQGKYRLVFREASHQKQAGEDSD